VTKLRSRVGKKEHKVVILSQFKTAKSYRQFIMEGLALDENPLRKSVGGTLLGPAEFVEKFKEEMTQKKERDFSGKRELFKSSPEKLREFLKDKDRNFKIYCFWKIAKITQKEIAAMHSRTYSSISHAVRRFEEKMAQDEDLRKSVQAIECKIQDSRSDPITCVLF
jgi:hypothetical protein